DHGHVEADFHDGGRVYNDGVNKLLIRYFVRKNAWVYLTEVGSQSPLGGSPLLGVNAPIGQMQAKRIEMNGITYELRVTFTKLHLDAYGRDGTAEFDYELYSNK
ncbi:hypothetical protein ACFL47_05030, partial [Candidatus Latescibacterota bacterium]